MLWPCRMQHGIGLSTFLCLALHNIMSTIGWSRLSLRQWIRLQTKKFLLERDGWFWQYMPRKTFCPWWNLVCVEYCWISRSHKIICPCTWSILPIRNGKARKLRYCWVRFYYRSYTSPNNWRENNNKSSTSALQLHSRQFKLPVFEKWSTAIWATLWMWFAQYRRLGQRFLSTSKYDFYKIVYLLVNKNVAGW